MARRTKVSPVVIMLFHNRTADAAETDQRCASMPQAQATRCRSPKRPAGLSVSMRGVRPQAQRTMSRGWLMREKYSGPGKSSISPCPPSLFM